MSTVNRYPDIFNELKAQVRKAGLLERVPVRGSIEMIAILLSIIITFATAPLWNPILLGLFLTLLFTRSVFVSHDIYFTDSLADTIFYFSSTKNIEKFVL